MSKKYGLRKDFAPVRQDVSRTIIGYDLQPVDDEHYTWHEVCFYKKRDGIPDLERIREAVIADIDDRTRQRIISTLTWNGKPVWLSLENQMDWKAAYDRAFQTEGANLPQKFKLGEDNDGNPVYHTFTSLNAFADFTETWQQHIQQCITDGWAMKDNMDWSAFDINESPSDSGSR